ncbi:MAG: hypothetical protein QM586_18010 [Xenophilus sp.]
MTGLHDPLFFSQAALVPVPRCRPTPPRRLLAMGFATSVPAARPGRKWARP